MDILFLYILVGRTLTCYNTAQGISIMAGTSDLCSDVYP